ncbi:MAG: hypothetical protein ACRC8A_13395 [Microcoleaceae cyanobacterium]
MKQSIDPVSKLLDQENVKQLDAVSRVILIQLIWSMAGLNHTKREEAV